VLEVSASANIAQIKTAYRKKIALYHPDKVARLGSELRQLAEVRAKEINLAYALACKLRDHAK
jgi:DnaJ-class molecular chaperone